MNHRPFLTTLHVGLTVAVVTFFSGAAFADSIPVTVRGGSAAFQGPYANISGPGVSIFFDNIDGNEFQFGCATSPCTGTVPIFVNPSIFWVSANFTLTIDAFTFSDTPGQYQLSTTGSISGALNGGPVPSGFPLDYSRLPNGSFSLSVAGPVDLPLTVS